MANILLAGDSWGIGVFEKNNNDYGPIGRGVHTILNDIGHSVTNISKAGGSNWLMIDRLENNWDNYERCSWGVDPNDRVDFNWELVDYVIFLQTDIFRERYTYVKSSPTDEFTQMKQLDQLFVDSLVGYDTLVDMIDQYFSNFYSRLDSIGKIHNKKILMLGCWGQIHPSIINYSNLVLVAPSATKLLIPELVQDVYLSDPEWYSQLANESRFMKKFAVEFKTMTISAEDKLKLIYKHWNGEVHPNIQGYQQLVDKIVLHFG